MKRLPLIVLLVGGLFAMAIGQTRASPAHRPARTFHALSVAHAPADQTIGTVAVCKVGADATTVGHSFTFGLSVPGTFAGSTITSVIVPAGTLSSPGCSSAINYPANTNLTVTESAATGFQLTGITINGGTNPLVNLAAGTASITTGTGSISLTFTNAVAPTATPTGTATGTATSTATPTSTPTASVSPTATSTGTAGPTATSTSTGTSTPTPTGTAAPPTSTATPVPPTNTPVPPAPTNTPKPRKPTATATTPAPSAPSPAAPSPPTSKPVQPPKTLPSTGFGGLNGTVARDAAMGRVYREARGHVALGIIGQPRGGGGEPFSPVVPVALGLTALVLALLTRRVALARRQ